MRDRHSFICASIVQNAPVRQQEAAMRRYLAVCEVEALCAVLGFTRCAAVITVAAKNRVATSTVWRWLRCVEGVNRRPADRLRWLLGTRSRKMHPEHQRLLEESADAR